VVTYTNDSAGRLNALSTTATSYGPSAGVSNIGYAAHHGLKTETYGNGLIHAVNYNNRLQTTEIKLGTSGSPGSAVSLGYGYGTTDNNGNVRSHTYSGGGLSYTQSFDYDALNRLTTSSESGSSWSQTNGYDRYGNRWIDLGGGNQSLYFTTSNNRIAGSSYDSAGNLLNDGAHSYSYDAENKITDVDSLSAYVYDGEGQRVRKLAGENLRFVYGIGGQLIAEFSGVNGLLLKEYVYGASGLLATIEPTGVNSNGTRYTTPDHLGSPRVVTNSVASVISRHDYMPFGEELGAGVGGRTTGIGFPGASDGLRKKFTAHERDNETGLDYMQARYYQNLQGRFTSADPLLASGKSANPQSWNRYSYVLNNPVRLTDPTGYDGTDTNPDPQQKPPPQPKTLDLRLDPNIVSAIKEIKENATPLKTGESPQLTSVVVVEGQTSNVENTNLIDASGTVSPRPFTGTIKPIAYIPLDQRDNIIPSGNGIVLTEQVKTVRGPDATATGRVLPPPNGVFIDIQSIPKGMETVEIKQGVRVEQGRIQIDFGPHQIIKDAEAGTINFTRGPQKQRILP
jgi:RHS repeat-associated protein